MTSPSNQLNFFFSNRLEVLYQQLKQSLFDSELLPLMKRLVVVSGPAMKTWIMLKMAQDPDLNVAFGVEFVYLSQAFEMLLKMANPENKAHFPTTMELALAIENELKRTLYQYQELDSQEKSDWIPFLHYLKISSSECHPSLMLSRKIEKRLISLSEQLARLFQRYGRFAPEKTALWEKEEFTSIHYSEWQIRLWNRLFNRNMNWTYSSKALLYAGKPDVPFTLHFFSISFISITEFAFLQRLSKNMPVYYYLLSPCAVFWSDIRSDRENVYLQGYWERRLGHSSSQFCQLEEFLRDRNALLANYGRLGREMACQIDESDANIQSLYLLPENVLKLDGTLFFHEDLFLSKTEDSLCLLHALQADLLMMRKPADSLAVDIDESLSIQLHCAPNKRREVEILYHNLLGLISRDSSLTPGDIIVMSPQIGDYVSYIQGIFGSDESLMDFQILDLGMHIQSEMVQGFLQLIELAEGRWDSNHLLQLFKHKAFRRRHRLLPNDCAIIQKWIEETNICWGENWLHRNSLLKRSHCQQGMVESTMAGTWDHGISQLLHGLTTVFNDMHESHLDFIPFSGVDFSQSDLLGKWIQLLHSLRDDLSLLEDQSKMTMENWVNFLLCLLDNYFQPDREDQKSMEEYEDLKDQFEILRSSTRFFKSALYTFTSIKTHLMSLLQNRGMTYREDRLHGVRFCSLVPLRSIPAKVIALLGMQEGTFPRCDLQTSLNLLIKDEKANYYPSSTDDDRYLFLESLHSAQDYFLLSYIAHSSVDNKELQPSLIVQELFSYLDKFYTIHGKKVSDQCVFHHPYDSFHESYFTKGSRLFNFSLKDFADAKTHYEDKKSDPHCFLNDFICEIPELSKPLEKNQIDIKHLLSAVRNPIKFYLNKGLEIYLQTYEDRQIKIEEEWSLSALCKHRLKTLALNYSWESIQNRARKTGNLPFGLFKEVALKGLKEEIENIHEGMSYHDVNPESLFQIDFSSGCSKPEKVDVKRWLFPPIVLTDINGVDLSIVGRLSNATAKGLISMGKGSLIDAWKVFPEFLLFCHAAKLSPEKWASRLMFTAESNAKESFFNDPIPLIKSLVHYYFLCLHNFSPLLPEWLPLILENNLKGLEDKMAKLHEESFGMYQSPELKWICHPLKIPNPKTLLAQWGGHAENLLGGLINSWYKSSQK